MNWRDYVRGHLPSLDVPAAREIEIVEELASQLEATYERTRNRGASEEEAVAAAQQEVADWSALARALAGIECKLLDPIVPGAPGGLMNGVLDDLRYAFRSLRGTPMFTAVCFVTITLGLGLGAATFAVLDTILIRPLPFPAPERLVIVHATVPPDGQDTVEVTYLDAVDLARESSVFASMGTVIPYSGTTTSTTPPERIQGFDVSPTLFATLGAQPFLGRAFTQEEGEPGQDLVVILAHGFWQRLGSNPSVVGQTLVIDEVPRTVVGVMPPGFSLEVLTQPPDVYRPVTRQHFAGDSRAFRAFRAIGRLQEGTTIQQATSAAAVVADRLAREFPDTNAGRTFSVVPLRDEVVGATRSSLLLVAGLLAIVLSIAAVNLASLLLARAVTRVREVALRAALGANLWRLARASAVEAAVLASTGAVAGWFLARALVRLLTRIPGVALPRLSELTIDMRALAVLVIASTVVMLIVAAIPFVIHGRLRRVAALRGGHETPALVAARLRSTMVVVQTALAFVLIAAAALLTMSLWRVLSVPSGFAAGVATMRLSIPAVRYNSRESTFRFFTDLVDELRQQPGIQQAGFVSVLPLSGNTGSTLTIQAREDIPIAMRPSIGWQWADAHYFEAMGIPLVRGRGFLPSDLTGTTHVTLINHTLANLYFPNEDPIGKRVYFGGFPATGVPEWHEIVGVVGDVRHRSLEREPDARAYDLFGQHWGRTISLAVRSSASPSHVAGTLRSIVSRSDPRLAVYAVRSTDELIDGALTTRRLLLILVAMLAAIGFAVALLGVYGIVACMVADRWREIGVRVALGAGSRTIRRLVIGHGLRLVAGGVVFGLAGAILLRRAIEAQLFNVSALSMLVLTFVAGALLLAAAVPCAIVSNRAVRIDPVAALKRE